MLRVARADADADQPHAATSRRRDLGRGRPVGVQVGRVDVPADVALAAALVLPRVAARLTVE